MWWAYTYCTTTGQEASTQLWGSPSTTPSESEGAQYLGTHWPGCWPPQPSHIANLGTQDIINVLIDNRVPAEWVDHAYPYGVVTLNGLYSGAIINQGLLDPLDNERLTR